MLRRALASWRFRAIRYREQLFSSFLPHSSRVLFLSDVKSTRLVQTSFVFRRRRLDNFFAATAATGARVSFASNEKHGALPKLKKQRACAQGARVGEGGERNCFIPAKIHSRACNHGAGRNRSFIRATVRRGLAACGRLPAFFSPLPLA